MQLNVEIGGNLSVIVSEQLNQAIAFMDDRESKRDSSHRFQTNEILILSIFKWSNPCLDEIHRESLLNDRHQFTFHH